MKRFEGPLVVVMRQQRIRAAALVLAVLASATGCDQMLSSAGVGPRRAIAPERITAPPVSDPVMGALSQLARHIIIALRNPATRVAIINAMRTAQPAGLGLDLTVCGSPGPVHDLLATGEARGGARAADMCALIANRPGTMLYMNSAALATWDASVIPTVVAIEHPEQRLPHSFVGYRSPTRTIALSDTAPLSGPLLIVLGTTHPGALAHKSFTHLQTVAETYYADSARHTSP